MNAPTTHFKRGHCAPMLLVLLAAGCGWAGSAAAVDIVHNGTHCRSNGASTETAAGELINDTLGVNPDDFVTYTCPVAMPRSFGQTSVTVKVTGATNFRSGQSFCMLRSVNEAGNVFHQDQSGFFATNNTTSKQVDTVTMTVTLLPYGVPNSVHLRCRLTSNSSSTNPIRPKNSIIMYSVEP